MSIQSGDDDERLTNVLATEFPDAPVSPSASPRGSLGIGQSVSSGDMQMESMSSYASPMLAVRMRGFMYKRPPESGIAGAVRVLAAEWRRRYFVLVAFEKPESRSDESLRLDVSERLALAAHEPSAGAGRRRVLLTKSWDTLGNADLPSCELLLCWFANKEKCDEWLRFLTPSSMIPGCYELACATDEPSPARSPGARRPSLLGLRSDSKQILATEFGGCLGSLAMSTVSSIREALRMDLSYRTLELAAPGRTFFLGVEQLDEFIEWRASLGAALANDADPSQANQTSMFTSQNRLPVPRMTSTRTTHVIREQPNKWVYEVPLRTFHVFWYILLVWTVLWLWALVFLMNPMVAPCDTGAQTNVSGGVCYDLETREPVTSCAGWQEAADRMGPVFSWVGALQPSGLFSRRFQLSGEVQDCFQLPSVLVHVLFWIFVFCELITGYSTLVASRLNWRVVRRGARMLHQMVPDFPRAAWPRVDLLICHYGEPAEETIETLKCALAQEYVASKLHIYICDDGYYKSDFKAVDAGTAHWPTAKVNSGLVQSTGNVREAVQNFMTALAAERGGASQVDEGRLAAKVRSVMPDPSSASRVVARLDCAVGFTEDRYDLQGLPTVSYVARVKPKTHHSKAGNINNVLYNVQCTRFGDEGPATYDGGSYVCIFDNDMEPHPLFLVSSLPLFFESLADGAADADAHMPPMLQAGPGQDASPYTDAPERNALAYVQTPQYFRQNELMLAVGGDPLSHES